VIWRYFFNRDKPNVGDNKSSFGKAERTEKEHNIVLARLPHSIPERHVVSASLPQLKAVLDVLLQIKRDVFVKH